MLLRKRTSQWSGFCSAIFFALATICVAAPPPGKGGGSGGGGGGEDPPPNLPPMAYDLTFLPVEGKVTLVKSINNALQVVGYTSQSVDGITYNDGFVYDHESGVVMTLGDLISAVDLATIIGHGFLQSRFHDINDAGLLVGDVSSADNLRRDGILIDLNTGALSFASSLGYMGKCSLFQINNSGDLLGYHFEGDNTTYDTFVAKLDAGTGQISVTRELGQIARNTFVRSEVSDTGLIMLGGGCLSDLGIRHRNRYSKRSV